MNNYKYTMYVSFKFGIQIFFLSGRKFESQIWKRDVVAI